MYGHVLVGQKLAIWRHGGHINVTSASKQVKADLWPFRLRHRFISASTHLATDVPVGETDNHPVLGCVVLVLVLYDQALAGKEVSLALWMKAQEELAKMTPCFTLTGHQTPAWQSRGCLTSPPPELDLVPLEVGLVLHYLNKTLQADTHQLQCRGQKHTATENTSTLLHSVLSERVSISRLSQRKRTR